MLQICMMSLPFSKFSVPTKENLYFQGKMCLCQFSPCSQQLAGWLPPARFEAAVGLSLRRCCRRIPKEDIGAARSPGD